MDFLQRQDLLLGEKLSYYIADKRVVIIGLGGVGGAALESIVRCGIKNILIWDNDFVDISNLNRQIISLQSNVGQSKVYVAKKRAEDINKDVIITDINETYTKEKNDILNNFNPDFIIDAIDTITHKISIIEFAYNNDIKVISSMGTGNKIDPFKYSVMKVEDTKGSPCTLAKVIRRELRLRNIKNIPVVCSSAKLYSKKTISNFGRHSPGSISFLPPISGYLMAGFVVNSFISEFSK